MFIINYTIFSLIIILLIENIDKLTKYFNIGGVTVEGLPDADAGADADADADAGAEVDPDAGADADAGAEVDPVEVDGENCTVVQEVSWVVFWIVMVLAVLLGGFGVWMWGRRSKVAEAPATLVEGAQG